MSGRVGESSSSRRRTAAKSPRYDRSITVFSPEGRVFQVDYARNSVKLEGITSVAVRGADSVCVITQRTKAPADPLLDTADPAFMHLFQITERLGMLATGMPADGRALAQQARNEAAGFRYKWGYEMPPKMLAQWLGDRAQVRTQHAGMRPYRVVATVVGIDEEKGTPELFTCDPAGQVLGHKATSVGLKEQEAIEFLEEAMAGNSSLSFQETMEMAVSALRHVLENNNQGHDIEVGVVRKNYPAFRTVWRRIYKSPVAGQNILDGEGQ
ncbi:unnamed protein product [Triticum aestivum]|uniref:Proteasome subunit alpha type n=4 Tax=Triticinae TaxID=1648030 RepID=A0A7H4LEG0_WHEAT|nr:proteasome subunit alpha type-6-like [Aegilops tauschii subsp. strangulata]XP_044331136.1 proteasome subunit alpha type-6-like [Triticum aestivum]SPT16998.1 unnamed protein product [Triticum aestivum]